MNSRDIICALIFILPFTTHAGWFDISGRNKPKFGCKNLPFTGLMTCGHCGRAITGEEKRKSNGTTYVYYHCTGTKSQCSNVIYLEQKLIASIFDEGVRKITIPSDVAEQAKEKIISSHDQDLIIARNHIRTLKAEFTNIEVMMSSAYEDKLKGKIQESFWQMQYSQWEKRKSEITSSISFHENSHSKIAKKGLETLELAKNLVSLYEKQDLSEKRKMIGLVLSNCKIVGGSIQYSYKSPFDLFVKCSETKIWGG